MVNQFAEILSMDEEKAEETGGEADSLSVAPAVSHLSDAHDEPAAAPAPEVPHETADFVSPVLAPEQAAATEIPEAVASGDDLQSAGAAAEAPMEAKVESASPPGNVVVLPFGEHGWSNGAAAERDDDERQGTFGKRRFAALAAMVALATATGAFGGVMATTALFHKPEVASSNPALEASVARIDADVLALKASLEYGSRLGQIQFNKTNERLDKIEKAQAEPAAKLARLSDAVDKLRAAPAPALAPAPLPAPVALAPAAQKDVTGSVPPLAAASTPKTEVGRLPTVEGWVLRDVVHGGALIDGRRGMYEVYAGDVIPGLGRIDAIRRQDGRWVVVTSKGLIVAR
jgi:hypothetical protein